MRPLPVLLGAVLGLASRTAEAGDNDFRLNAMRDGEGVLFSQDGSTYRPNEEAWRAFATELGFVFAPRLASPAQTLGHGGFSFGALWSGTFVSADEPYWRVTERGQRGRPNKVLQTLQLDVRKGLPFSFEVGVGFVWLVESQLFAPGLEVRWALAEGHPIWPDAAVRGAVNHMIGSRDMLLTTATLDGSVSKSFGLFGTMSVTPYLGWALVFIAASSRVIDPTPAAEVAVGGSGGPIDADVMNDFVFPEVKPTSKIHHKLTLGLRTVYYVLNVSVQGELQMAEGGLFGSVATLSTKLGLDF